MALIYEGMKCAICDQPLDIHGRLVATSHFIGESDDPLWRFSDAAMHYVCFQNWQLRETFVARYNETMGKIVWGNGTRHHMNSDGMIVSMRAASG